MYVSVMLQYHEFSELTSILTLAYILHSNIPVKVECS